MKNEDLQSDLDSIADQFVQRIREATPEIHFGIFATWEACFRMGMRGECEHAIADHKLTVLLNLLKP